MSMADESGSPGRGASGEAGTRGADGPGIDIARDSDVPISTQLYWQLAYQIDTGRLHAGARLPTVRELGGILRVNPNTVRAVYRRLADAGYVVARQGAGTRVAARSTQRRVSEGLDGLVAELLRRAAGAGYSADEVASAVYSAAAERKRPGPKVQILFAECTSADARRGASQIDEAFLGVADVDPALIDHAVERLERLHYDLVATPTFHAAEMVELVAGRAPVIAMLAAPSYAELLEEIRALPSGSTVGLICSSVRSTQSMSEWLASSPSNGVTLLPAHVGDEAALSRADRESDLVLLSREAIEIGLAERFVRPERFREWAYDLDPAGLELLRRAIDSVRLARSGAAGEMPRSAVDPGA